MQVSQRMGTNVGIFGYPWLVVSMGLVSYLSPKGISIEINIGILIFWEVKNITELKEANGMVLVS